MVHGAEEAAALVRPEGAPEARDAQVLESRRDERAVLSGREGRRGRGHGFPPSAAPGYRHGAVAGG